MKSIYRILTLLSLLTFVASVYSQQMAAEARPVTSVVSYKMGQGQVRNSYLTPLLYTGTSYGLEGQRWRLQRNLKWTNFQLLDLSFVSATDKGEHSEDWSGRLRYRYGVLRRWAVSAAHWVFFAGPYLGADLGFDYNLKMASANNPATVRAALNAGAMGVASYAFQVRGQRIPVLLQGRLPLLGAAFQPEYGASYYETFYLDAGGQTAHLTSVHNQQDFDLQLTADVPLAVIPWFRRYDSVIRLGAAYHIETMDINAITTRFSTIEFSVGWVYQHLPFSRRKSHLLTAMPNEAY